MFETDLLVQGLVDLLKELWLLSMFWHPDIEKEEMDSADKVKESSAS